MRQGHETSILVRQHYCREHGVRKRRNGQHVLRQERDWEVTLQTIGQSRHDREQKYGSRKGMKD